MEQTSVSTVQASLLSYFPSLGAALDSLLCQVAAKRGVLEQSPTESGNWRADLRSDYDDNEEIEESYDSLAI